MAEALANYEPPLGLRAHRSANALRLVSEHPPGTHAGVLAIHHVDLAIDEGGLIALRTLDVARRTTRKVEHQRVLTLSHRVEVEDVDVAALADRQPAPIVEAKDTRRAGSQPADPLAEAVKALLAHPGRQHEAAPTRVHDLRDVCTGVTQTRADSLSNRSPSSAVVTIISNTVFVPIFLCRIRDLSTVVAGII